MCQNSHQKVTVGNKLLGQAGPEGRERGATIFRRNGFFLTLPSGGGVGGGGGWWGAGGEALKERAFTSRHKGLGSGPRFQHECVSSEFVHGRQTAGHWDVCVEAAKRPQGGFPTTHAPSTAAQHTPRAQGHWDLSTRCELPRPGPPPAPSLPLDLPPETRRKQGAEPLGSQNLVGTTGPARPTPQAPSPACDSDT